MGKEGIAVTGEGFINRAVGCLKEFYSNTRAYYREEKTVLLKSYFNDWSIYEKLWLSISTIMCIVSSFLMWDSSNTAISIIFTVACLMGWWCQILVAKTQISNFISSILSVILFIVVAYLDKSFMRVIVYAFFFLPVEVYGWHTWIKTKNKVQSNTVKVRTFRTIERKSRYFITVLCLIVVASGIFAYSIFVFGVDSYYTIIVITLSLCVSTILKVNRFIEYWIISIILSISILISIGFSSYDQLDTGVIIALSLLLSNYSWGLVNWLKVSDNMFITFKKRETK